MPACRTGASDGMSKHHPISGQLPLSSARYRARIGVWSTNGPRAGSIGIGAECSNSRREGGGAAEAATRQISQISARAHSDGINSLAGLGP